MLFYIFKSVWSQLTEHISFIEADMFHRIYEHVLVNKSEDEAKAIWCCYDEKNKRWNCCSYVSKHWRLWDYEISD